MFLFKTRIYKHKNVNTFELRITKPYLNIQGMNYVEVFIDLTNKEVQYLVIRSCKKLHIHLQGTTHDRTSWTAPNRHWTFNNHTTSEQISIL
jgi:hypothetical protein